MQYFKNNYTTLFKKYNNLDDQFCDKNYTFTILNNLLDYLYEMNIFLKNWPGQGFYIAIYGPLVATVRHCNILNKDMIAN